MNEAEKIRSLSGAEAPDFEDGKTPDLLYLSERIW